MVGADRSGCFKHCLQRIRERTSGLKGKHISLGGKEILIKVMANAIHFFCNFSA